MLFILAGYLGLVYLVFVKFKLLPLNPLTRGLIVLVGVIILTVFMVHLQTLVPASARGMLIATFTEIAPQVTGRVIEVPIEHNQDVDVNQVLFRINPRPFQRQVEQLKAVLVQTESGVAQLKESADAARAQVKSTQANLALSQTRLAELEQLLAAGAGSRFDVENKATEVASLEQTLLAAEATENQALLALNARVGDRQSQVAQVLAQLDIAQFNLENSEVRAPAPGSVVMNVLRPGMVVTPGRAVMTFVYRDPVVVVGFFPQKALRNVQLGDKVQITFPAFPGEVFESTVRRIPGAIGNAQIAASGQVVGVGESRMTTLYPVYMELPADFPRDQVRPGLAAFPRIYTEEAGGPVSGVANIMQWIQTSLAYMQ
jgi:multidrug resistance efflux pump